jgi:uncharacterized repeat protein (TIGR03803 family)
MKILKRNTFFLVLLCLINNTAYSQFHRLHEFANDGKTMFPVNYLSTDGVWLYGVTSQGGSNDLGALFKVRTDGSDFTIIMDFDSVNNFSLERSLTIYNNSIYGTSRVGGTSNLGYVFKVNTDGTGFTHLIDFEQNGKAIEPRSSLIVVNDFLYGVADGGQNHCGVIYRLNPDGSVYDVVYNFSGDLQGGYLPRGELSYQDGFLYGVNFSGGKNNIGTIFKVKTDGTQYSDIYNYSNSSVGSANNIILGADNILYGTTYTVGSNYACLFKINTDGINYTKLWDFNIVDGYSPEGDLRFHNNAVFGECYSGAANDLGCLFEFNTTDSVYSKLKEFYTYSEWNWSFALTDNSIYYGSSESDKCSTGTIVKVPVNGGDVTVVYNFNTCPLTERHPDNIFFHGSKIYGHTGGGDRGFGTIFSMNPDGSGYTRIFEPETGQNIDYYSIITVEGDWFYGSGSSRDGKGCLFKIRSDGSSFTPIFTLDGINDKNLGQVFYSNGTFFCSTLDDGKNNKGKFFKVNLDGSGYTVLIDFDTKVSSIIFGSNVFYFFFQYGLYNDQAYISKIKSDGTSYSKIYDFQDAILCTSFIFSEGYLFGTSYFYGENNCGYIFKLKPDGTEYNVLHNFGGLDGTNPGYQMICYNGYLYGMTDMGGADFSGDGRSENYATIFRIKTDGTEFQTLLNFDQKTPVGSRGDFILSDNMLYVITYKLGLYQKGSLFELSLDGTKYKKLVDFGGAGNGSDPRTLIMADHVLYGCTYSGGTGNVGIIYSYKLQATGLNDVSELEVAIYPNPSSDGSVFVELNKQISSNTFIEIFNLTGQVLITKPMQSSRDELDLTRFANGMYMIRIRSDQTLLKTEKLVLE